MPDSLASSNGIWYTDLMTITEVWIPGHPRTKGSLDPKNMQDTPESKRWRVLMADAVRTDIARRDPSYVPTLLSVVVTLHAFLVAPPVPVGEPAWRAAIWPGAGDVDKLARNALDALAADSRVALRNGGAYHNDNQVTMLIATKQVVVAPSQMGLYLHAAYANATTMGNVEVVAAQRRNTIRGRAR